MRTVHKKRGLAAKSGVRRRPRPECFEQFASVRSVLGCLCRELRSLIDSLDSLQFLQQTAATTTQVFPPRPFHSRRPTFPALVQVPGGPLKTRLGIEYDDSFLCHAVTMPECPDERNLSL